MKVLHVNTVPKGGAANACIGLHKALIEIGIDSKFLSLNKSNQYIPQHHVFKQLAPPRSDSFFKKLKKNLSKKDERQKRTSFVKEVSKEADHFSFLETPYDITQLPVFKEADIINLHWTAEFLDWPSFFSSKNKKKIVWTLHDMHPFTGGYHYAGNYKGYQSDDKAYPPAQGSLFPNAAQYNLKWKKEILKQFKTPLHIVTPSQWLHEVSKSSALFGNYSHYTIPNSVDTSVFRPFNQRLCREILGIPSDKLVLLFVSQDIDKPRKGFKILLDSIPLLSDIPDLLVCSAGNMPTDLNTGTIQHIPLHSIGDSRLMAVAYNAADAFVIPSLEDNLPNTVLESLACATPVIGFSIGGIREMVKNEFNGILTKEISEEGLANAIRLFRDKHTAFNANATRKDVLSKYTPAIQAKAYYNLYKQI